MFLREEPTGSDRFLWGALGSLVFLALAGAFWIILFYQPTPPPKTHPTMPSQERVRFLIEHFQIVDGHPIPAPIKASVEQYVARRGGEVNRWTYIELSPGKWQVEADLKIPPKRDTALWSVRLPEGGFPAIDSQNELATRIIAEADLSPGHPPTGKPF